jgi:ATP-dependent DNA helicase Rep
MMACALRGPSLTSLAGLADPPARDRVPDPIRYSKAMPLNRKQQRAVEHVDGPLLVLAGAGSGKTRVITQKIASLVTRHGFAPHEVAAVTFTNKAAREMRQRVMSLVDPEVAEGVRISTFHTLGLNILRREYGHTPYRRNFSILDAGDSRALIRDQLQQAGRDTDEILEETVRRISAWKNELCDPETALADADNDSTAAKARSFKSYQDALQSYNALDFDDLIGLPVDIFREVPEALRAWRERIRYLLCDEYQDTNGAQYELMKMLVGEEAMFTVVGDDDQSIYAWRGARPETLRTLSDDFPGLTVIPLEQNYRSTSRILDAANSVISNNPHLFEKKLHSLCGAGDQLRIMRARDATDEAERVAMEIARRQMTSSATWGDFAILYRGNHQSRLFEQELQSRAIPFRVSGGPSFFDRSEVKDIMAYLRLVANPDDDIAYLRVVNIPRREIGSTSVRKLGEYAGSRGQSLLEASLEAGLHGVLPDRAVLRLQRFGRWIVESEDSLSRGEAPHEFAARLVDDIGYQEWLHDNCRDKRQADRCMENVEELIGWIRSLGRTKGDSDLAGLLAYIGLMDMLDREDEEKRDDAVSLMTLHAAKGLEFPHVYLVGAEEGLLPHKNSLDESALEEERRLAYVGITRAMQTLVISHAERRKRYGETMVCEPSRFLAELPRSDIIWEGQADERSPDERRRQGRTAIDDLRRLLAGS